MILLAITAALFWNSLLTPDVWSVPRPQSQRRPPIQKTIGNRNNDIENLIIGARSLPPEFAVDILLRVASSNRVDKQWKQEILEEAFSITSDLQNDLREKVIPVPGASVDTRVGYRSYAFELKLDALSTRVRIIDQMMFLNKRHALRMFEQISPKFSFKTLSCSDRMVYELGDFYRLLEKIVRAGYDQKKIEQGERIQFLLPYIETMTSPAQITPIANLLVSLDLRPREALIAIQSFTNALKTISADDRLFTAAITGDGTTSAVFRLTQSLRKNEVSSNELRNAYRAYLEKHLTATRCEDNVGLVGDDLPYYLKEINHFYPDAPFTRDDIRPRDTQAASAVMEYFESNEANKLLSEFKSLRGYDDDDLTTREPKTSAAWHERMLDYLRTLEKWDGRGEANENDYFHQKCNLYLALLQIVPTGESLDQALLSYLKLLSKETPGSLSRIEWLLHSNDLFRWIRKKPVDERSHLLTIILNSKNSVLQVYAEATKADSF